MICLAIIFLTVLTVKRETDLFYVLMYGANSIDLITYSLHVVGIFFNNKVWTSSVMLQISAV